MHHDGERIVIDAIRAARPPFDPAVVTKEFSDFLKLYGVTGVFGDNYGGEWPKAEFARTESITSCRNCISPDLYLKPIPVLSAVRQLVIDSVLANSAWPLATVIVAEHASHAVELKKSLNSLVTTAGSKGGRAARMASMTMRSPSWCI